MTGVQSLFHGGNTVAHFAICDIVSCEYQVINDGRGISPGLEQVIVLEKRVVSVAGMSNHQGLHGDTVFFHQVSNAGVGVDDDLIGQPHLPSPIAAFHLHELLAEGPVVVTHRHAHRGVGVHHLLGGNDLDLIGVSIQAIFIVGDVGDSLVIACQQFEIPVGPFGEIAAHASSMRFLKRCRKTG